jgi:hypothetical protein
MKIGDPKAFKITDLTSDIDTGKIRLPEFQRDFRWEANNVSELFASIISGYPAGTLLMWEVDDGKAKLQTRTIEQAKGTSEIKLLVLDGQQRLTSIYQTLKHPYVILRGDKERRFFINLSKLDSPDDAIETYSPVEVRKQNLDDRDVQVKRGLVPMNIISSSELDNWLDKLAKTRWMQAVSDPTKPDAMDEFTKIRNELTERYLKENKPLYNIKKYEFNSIVLPSSLGLDAVATIFEKLNTSGVELNVFEILTAKFYKLVNLREKWDEAKTTHPTIRKFMKDDKDTSIAILLLKTILLVKSATPLLEISGECKRSNLLNDLKAEDIPGYWDRVSKAFNLALAKLSNDYGVLLRKYMPYDTMLVPLAVVFDYVDRCVPTTEKSRAFEKIRAWYWVSVFTNRYDSSTDTKSKDDAEALMRWIADDKLVPDYVTTIKVDDVDLRNATRGAVYYGVLNILLGNGLKDFVTAESIRTLIETSPSGVDEHHIFPKNYLKRHYGEKSKENSLKNSVLNIAIIKDETNRDYIKDDAPSTYLTSTPMAKNLDNIRECHLIPTDIVKVVEDSTKKTQFMDFLAKREELIKGLISKNVKI